MTGSNRERAVRSIGRSSPYSRVLKDRRLSSVLAAHGISELGNGITEVALPLLVYAATGSIVATGVIFAVGLLPDLLFGLWAGVLADRFDRQKIVVAADLGRGVVLLIVPLLGSLWLVGVVAFISRTLGVFAAPATEAVLPSLAGELYQQLAALRSGARSLGTSVGPAIGGALVGLIGAREAIAVDAITFLIASAIIYSVSGFDPNVARRREERAATSHRGSELLQGLRYLRHNTVAFGMIVYWSVGLFAVPLSVVGALPYITGHLGRSSAEYGMAVTCFAVGSVLGMVLAGRFSYRLYRRFWMLGSGIGYGLCGLGLGLYPPYALFCLLWFAWGVAYGPEQVLGDVLLAESTTDAMRGRIYSVLGVALSAAMILGYLTAGPSIERFGAPAMMTVAGVIFVVSSAVAFGISPLSRAVGELEVPVDTPSH